jgi:hypothetical protein
MTITAGTPQSNKIGMFVSSPHLPVNNNALVQTEFRIRNGRATNYMSRELEDSNDDEPSLGWTTSGSQGAHCGGTDDLEAETEHDEDGDPAEPSLGSVGEMHFDQTQWAAGGRRDLELDGAASGIADQDGLDEQVPFRDWQRVGMV